MRAQLNISHVVYINNKMEVMKLSQMK